MRPARSLLLALALAACSSGKATDSATAPCSGLALEPGEGEFAFAPRADGDSITMVHGQQGGWHIDLAGRIDGSTGTVTVVPSVIEANQQVSLAGEGQEEGEVVALAGYESCTGTFFALRAFLDDVDPGGDYQRFICTLEGNAFEVRIDATDSETGETATSSFRAIAQLDPDDVPICAAF